MKIAYNNCFGGFNLSEEAKLLAKKLSGNDRWGDDYFYMSEREDKILIQIIETLGNKASMGCSELRIKEIPDGSRYEIDEDDGFEEILPLREKGWK